MRYKQIGNRIYSLRKEKKISQEELAYKTGIGLSTIKRIEYGEKGSCNLEYIEKIANVLKIQIHEILPNKYREILQKIFDDEDDVERLIKHQLVFYPSVRDEYEYPIITLFEFLTYLPLFDYHQLIDVLANRFQGEFFEFEIYVCKQLKFLYHNIKDKEARKYADLMKKKLNYKSIFSSYKTDELLDAELEYKEKSGCVDYKIGEQRYFQRLEYLYEVSAAQRRSKSNP